ncbi:hypothetical protein ACFIOY_21985 [Bradyrhizobium sp. TZ2]
MKETNQPHLQLVDANGGGIESRPHRRKRVYVAAFVGAIALIVGSLYAVLDLLHTGNLPLASGRITIATPMSDAILQNTPGQSEGYPFGVPKGYAWCSGSYKPEGNSAPPLDFTSVTSKGQVYPELGAPPYSGPGGSIMIANAKTYVHLRTTREWAIVQDQATSGIAGAHFTSDFSPELSKEMRLDAQPDGSVVIGAPPKGYSNQFLGQSCEARMQLEQSTGCMCKWICERMIPAENSLRVLEPIGGSTRTRDLCRIQKQLGAGISNWIKLSEQWSTIRFYS